MVGEPGPCGCGCALTYRTSYGFDAVDYAERVLMAPYRPWQRFVVIHAGELLADGRPRFNFVLILVARQNGKSAIWVRLAPYWLTEEMPHLPEYEFPPGLLATSTKVDYAKKLWQQSRKLVERQPHLRKLIARDGVRLSNGEIELKTVDDCSYYVSAQNDDAGRSMTLYRGLLDEMRQMQHYDAHDALVNATNAVPEAQVFGLSNQGDDSAVVLDELRDSALLWINTDGADGDPRLGLFEYSAPLGSDPTDPEALAMANPDLGNKVLLDSLIGRARRAKAAGGEQLARFQIEVLCMRVRKIDAAIPAHHWVACKDESIGEDWSAHRGRVVACLDISLDGLHATLAVAAVVPSTVEGMPDVVRLGVAKAWDGGDATAQLKRELPGLLRTIRPRLLAWFPNGPAAAIAPELLKPRGGVMVIPRGTRIREVRGDATAACMGLAELAKSVGVVHNGDPLLEQHVTGAERLWQGDAWRFVRRGAGHCDAAYAAAGAVHEARVLPAPVRPGVVKAAPRG